MLKQERKRQFCKGCGERMRYPFVALSRFDNRTKVCSDCGTYEAMVQFTAMVDGTDPRRVLVGPGRLSA
jgi:RNase P subunit RPR2